MKPYTKSYKGFVLWFVVFLVLIFCIPFVPTENANLPTLLVMNCISVSMAVLTWMIWKNEKIYWYNSIEFEQAEKASVEQRKRYALRHAKRFTWYAAATLVYSPLAYRYNIPIAFNITVMALGVVAVAISTLNIKLDE